MGKYRSSSRSLNNTIDAVCTPQPHWLVNVAIQSKTGRYFAQIGPSVYVCDGRNEMESFLESIYSIDKSYATPFLIRPGEIKVKRGGRGQRVIIKGTLPANDLDYKVINSKVETTRGMLARVSE